jgi:hypothetical protein
LGISVTFFFLGCQKQIDSLSKKIFSFIKTRKVT